MILPFSDKSIFTLLPEKDRIRAESKNGEGFIVEKMPWTSAQKDLDALKGKQEMVLLFGDAHRIQGVEWFALIGEIVITPNFEDPRKATTKIFFSKLTKLAKVFPVSKLRLRSRGREGEYFSPYFQRPYALCELPKALRNYWSDLVPQSNEVGQVDGIGLKPEERATINQYRSFLMTWNPDVWPYAELSKVIRKFKKVGSTHVHWIIASHKKARIGDQAFFFKQGKGVRGIFARGVIIENPEPNYDDLKSNGTPRYTVKVRLDALSDPKSELIIPFAKLFTSSIWNAQASGNEIPRDQVDLIEDLWGGFLADKQCQAFREVTTSQAFQAVRTTQAEFRNKLIQKWGSCMVTGCVNPRVLVASHIVPWSIANNQERQDISNGLLLVANLDRLFDGYLISFDKTGRILISSNLTLKDQEILGLSKDMMLKSVPPELEKYLIRHRKQFKNKS